MPRKRLGLTLEQMAAMLGYEGESAKSQMHHLETGRREIRPAQRRLITGNAWWASFDAINLPPRAIHHFMGPRNDHVILQDGEVWIGKNKSR